MPDISSESNRFTVESLSSLNNEIVDKTEKPLNSDLILLLPSQLVNYRNKNYFASAAVFILGVAFSLYVREKAPALLSTLFSAFFLWKAASVANRYSSGKIAELTATCTGIMPSFYRDRFTVTFAAQSDDQDYVYYKFVVPNKRSREEFIIGAMYVIYFDRDAVNSLLGYLLLGSCTV